MNTVTSSKEGSLSTSEPVISVAGITAAASALLALVVSFGFDLTADQQVAIMGVVAVLAPLLVGIVARGKVFSPDAVARIESAHVDEVLLPEHAPVEHVPASVLPAEPVFDATEFDSSDEGEKQHDELDELPSENTPA